MEEVKNSAVKDGTLDLSNSSSPLGSVKIGDEGIKKICTLDTHNIRIIFLCKVDIPQAKTISLQSASLHYPRQSGIASNA